MNALKVTPIICPHGKAISWAGTARWGDPLPLIEHCQQCHPTTVTLNLPMIHLKEG